MLTQEPATGYLESRDGARLYYEVHGGGADTVVVPFATSLGRSLRPIATGRTVIFYDMRSRGRSDPIADSSRLGFAQDVLDLEDVRSHFEIKRMSLVGFSYLGGVVATYAARRPARVDRLVLLGGVGPTAEGAPPVNLDRLDRARLAALQEGYATTAYTDPVGYSREYWSTYLPLYVGAEGPAAANALAALQDSCTLPNERPTAFLPVLGQVIAGASAIDLRAVGAAIRSPTLILHGDSDYVAPLANARVWTEVIRNSRIEVIAGAGHLLWAEASTEVVAALDRFLPRRSP